MTPPNAPKPAERWHTPLRDLLAWQQPSSVAEEQALRWYVLLDVDAMGSWEQAAPLLAKLTQPATSPFNLYADLEETGLARQGPRLVELTQDLALRQMPLQELAAARGASFLAGAMPMPALAQHLHGLREVTLPDGGAALFRFQDPRVMHALAPTLNARQVAALLGPVAAWWSLDACGEVASLRHPDPAKAAAHNSRPASLSLSKLQLVAVDQALMPYELMAQTRAADSAALNGLSECAQLRSARLHIAKAQALGLDRQADIAMFGVLAFQLPQGFETQPPFAQAIAAAAQNKAGLSDALKQANPAEWQRWNDWLAKQDGMH
jgi:hypothetical protein